VAPVFIVRSADHRFMWSPPSASKVTRRHCVEATVSLFSLRSIAIWNVNLEHEA